MDSFNNVGVVCGEGREGVLLTQLLQEKGEKKGVGDIQGPEGKKKRSGKSSASPGVCTV